MAAFKGKIYNADDPDLDAMTKLGGKILMHHGWADVGINPLFSIRYLESVEARLAAQGAEDPQAAAAEILRLYMIPGMVHCRGGVGFDRVDWIAPLMAWVEDGVAPEAIEGANAAGATRPHCPYPRRAVWDGEGDPASAASFACR